MVIRIQVRMQKGLFSTGLPLMRASGARLSDAPPSANFLVWDWMSSYRIELLTAAESASNNESKATPELSGDILGDWREDVVGTWRTISLRLAPPSRRK